MPKKAKGPKLPSNLPDNFPETTNSMTTEELRQQILKSTATIDETTATRDGDANYKAAKDDYETYASGYNDVLKAEKAKIKFVIALLKERGQTIAGAAPAKTAA